MKFELMVMIQMDKNFKSLKVKSNCTEGEPVAVTGCSKELWNWLHLVLAAKSDDACL